MKEDKIEILPIDTKVKFGDEGQFKGKVSAITIKRYSVVYEIKFWKEHELKTIDLIEQDFKVLSKAEKKEIGFIAPE
jgi:hypothetical protein